MKKNVAALLVLVMVFALAVPAMAGYRTGSAAGDAAAYGAGGAAVGCGAYLAVSWLFGLACPPLAIASAVAVGGVYLGWYGATDADKNIVKDVERTAMAGTLGMTAGFGAVELIEKGAENVLQLAY